MFVGGLDPRLRGGDRRQSGFRVLRRADMRAPPRRPFALYWHGASEQPSASRPHGHAAPAVNPQVGTDTEPFLLGNSFTTALPLSLVAADMHTPVGIEKP